MRDFRYLGGVPGLHHVHVPSAKVIQACFSNCNNDQLGMVKRMGRFPSENITPLQRPGSLFASHLSVCFRLIILVQFFVQPFMVGNTADLVESPLTYLLTATTNRH